jgi:hypothetical protein
MEIRTVEVYRRGQWEEIHFKDLCHGDNFRMFESNGDSVTDEKGNVVFGCDGYPYKNQAGVWQINTH